MLHNLLRCRLKLCDYLYPTKFNKPCKYIAPTFSLTLSQKLTKINSYKNVISVVFNQKMNNNAYCLRKNMYIFILYFLVP